MSLTNSSNYIIESPGSLNRSVQSTRMTLAGLMEVATAVTMHRQNTRQEVERQREQPALPKIVPALLACALSGFRNWRQCWCLIKWSCMRIVQIPGVGVWFWMSITTVSFLQCVPSFHMSRHSSDSQPSICCNCGEKLQQLATIEILTYIPLVDNGGQLRHISHTYKKDVVDGMDVHDL